jgi:hypothetical protein
MGSVEKLHFLSNQQRSKLRCEALREVLVRLNSGPMPPTICIIVELSQMQDLVDGSGIGLEVPDQLFVMFALLEGRKPNLLIELDRASAIAPTRSV